MSYDRAAYDRAGASAFGIGLGISIDVTGFDEINDALTKVTTQETARIMRQAVLGVMREIGKGVRRAAPKKTGDLKKAIKWKRERSRRRGEFSAKLVFLPSGFYWRFIEFGTARIPPAPFIIPEVEKVRAKIGPIFREAFFKQYERALKKRTKKA